MGSGEVARLVLWTGFPGRAARASEAGLKEHPMAQNPRGEPIPPTPPRPADAARPKPIIDENARRLREWGPKIQIVSRRPQGGS
jgi:hypothetical protein